MKKVLVISDTHGLLRDEIKAELNAADVVIHAGDIDTIEVYDRLKTYPDVYMVKGNNDYRFKNNLPHTLRLAIEGVRIFAVHNKTDVPSDLSDVDIVIYGHSHQFHATTKDGVLWLNPGSCGQRRFHLGLSYCRLKIDNGTYQYEKVIIKP